MFGKKKPAAAPEKPPVVLPDDLKAAVRAEASSVMKMVGRAEAKAQATIRMSETVAKLEAMLAQERGESNRKLATMANELNKMMVIVSVLRDQAMLARQFEGYAPALREAKFNELCTLKNVQMNATGGKPS